MNELQDVLVAGESRIALMRALARLMVEQLPDGGCRIDGAWPPTLAGPLFAALMRVEAEMILEDADIVAGGEPALRTDGQRRADALVELARRVARPGSG